MVPLSPIFYGSVERANRTVQEKLAYWRADSIPPDSLNSDGTVKIGWRCGLRWATNAQVSKVCVRLSLQLSSKHICTTANHCRDTSEINKQLNELIQLHTTQ